MAQLLRTEKLKLVNKIGGSDITLFDGLNFSIEEKEWVNIAIQHGGGKTILYKVLLSQSKPTGGKLIYNNKDKIDDYDRDRYLRDNVTAVPEFPSLINDFTVRDWVRFQIELLRPAKYRKKLKEYFVYLASLGIEREKHTNQLTLLEIRMLEISFCKLADTLLVICDDIDVGLSKDDAEKLAGYLKELNKEKAIITISSDPIWSKYAKKVVRA